MIEDPIFWIAAIFAVLITGVSKGGLGGLGLFAVPIMALTISPVQAAGIMLPILIVMDWVSLWSYRKLWDKLTIIRILPAAILGVALGGVFAGGVNDDIVRILVGVIAVSFPIYAAVKPFLKLTPESAPVVYATSGPWFSPMGIMAGIAAGFTSFIAHAGGPPFQAYVMPKNLEKRVYAATAVMFFTVVNLVKLIPYAALGQFDATNLKTSAMLIPLAPIGVWIGIWAVKRVNQTVFYRIIYALIFITGLKLIFDGLF
ncbi:hypothetical protein DES40_1434 [Litorimonas taeanensis]|uniref:Probable membrane transporter protein n=1 Tax=Litorimonas taeanensis TaxID=568099 RepID=A0A420WM64_9PROT|nr:sulfite exporter TauE/SafE family protein [Litorimonas taeanensis]RKQ72097.1 hypothetical protein DES40_1434 [Litorimonas taeanensis]